MPTETMANTETQVQQCSSSAERIGSWTQKPDAPEVWVREIMLPHFLILGEKERMARTNISAKQDELANASEVLAFEKARQSRRRALIIPREHGAWGLLLVPMITGAGVAFRENAHAVPLFLLLTAALALFWLRTPMESLLGTSPMRAQSEDERRAVIGVIAGLGIVAAAALAGLLWAGRNPYLWLIGVLAVAAFVGQGLLKKFSRHRMLAEVIGTIGLTASAPAAYYVMTGKFGPTAIILWLANLMFAGNQIHYVQFRIHTARIEGLQAKLARGWAFALGQVLMTIALTVAGVGGLLPAFALLAFAPVLFRGWFYFVQQPGPLVVRRLGWSELTQAVVFCALFVATFSLPIG